MSARRPASIVLPLLLFLPLSCRPAIETAGGAFYALTEKGELVKTEVLSQTKVIAFQPWSHQVRVTDIYHGGGRFFLAVNRHGLAEISAEKDSVLIQYRYAENYFGGRTVTRIFPYKNELYFHVYFDADFPADRPGEAVSSAPAERIALLSYLPDHTSTGFNPVRMDLLPKNEAWEPVMARPIDSGDVAFEWKLSSPRRSEFRYTAFRLESGTEMEKTRAWFYDAAKPGPLTEGERDPVLRALVASVADSLKSETAGSVVLCAGYDPRTGREARYYFPAAGGIGQSIYRMVSLISSDDGWIALLPDRRFVRASSPDEKTWERGLLPELPAGFRYTGLAASGEWLCFSWEEIDFYRVGRAGIYLRKR